MQVMIQNTPAWQLDAKIAATPYGHNLTVTSFVPTARHPEHQVRFQALFTGAELRALRDLINQALGEQA